mgnify:CR=1 FL=1
MQVCLWIQFDSLYYFKSRSDDRGRDGEYLKFSRLRVLSFIYGDEVKVISEDIDVYYLCNVMDTSLVDICHLLVCLIP